MKDRVIKGNGKSSNVFFNLDGVSTFDDFKAANTGGTLQADVTANNSGTGTDEVGTPLSKANLLSDNTVATLGLTGDATVDDALGELASSVYGDITQTEPTLKASGATWTAPSNGVLSAVVTGNSGTTGIYYITDTTANKVVLRTQALSGGVQTGACGIVKGHTYRVTNYNNISSLFINFVPFMA